MAGSARYTAVLDACVLYPMLLRDLLLSLAHADLYSAKWTGHIRDEWVRAKLRDCPDRERQIISAAETMEAAISDCMVTGYEHLIGGLKLPDPDDRHVLAAAIAGHADAIVTLNEKDFPKESSTPSESRSRRRTSSSSISSCSTKLGRSQPSSRCASAGNGRM